MTQIVEAIFSMVGNQKDQMPNEVKGFQFEFFKAMTHSLWVIDYMIFILKYNPRSLVGLIPDKDNTPEKRVERIFQLMDKVTVNNFENFGKFEFRFTIDSMKFQDGNGCLSKEEFLQGAKQDKSIVQALSLYDGLI